MPKTYRDVIFSEYELREMGFKFAGDTAYTASDCVGSCEEEMETRKISKKCRGITKKRVTRGTGEGNLKVSMHIKRDIYDEMYGTKLDTLIEGVRAYGANSVHPEFSITQHVFDEDGVEEFKAYPKCVLESGKKSTITNGEEVVAEVELEITVLPDDAGNGVYYALKDDLTDESVKSTWMTAFTPSMVAKPTA